MLDTNKEEQRGRVCFVVFSMFLSSFDPFVCAPCHGGNTLECGQPPLIPGMCLQLRWGLVNSVVSRVRCSHAEEERVLKTQQVH